MIKIISGICIESIGRYENTQTICSYDGTMVCENCGNLLGNKIRENKRVLFTPILI